MKSIEVVAAIIQYQDTFLCVQRAPSKLPYVSEKYEFPGGKVEKNETHSEALIREIEEELSLSLTNTSFYMTVEHSYPDFHLIMHAFLCPITKPANIALNEHIDQQWLTRNELMQLDWAAADIPIVQKLIRSEN